MVGNEKYILKNYLYINKVSDSLVEGRSLANRSFYAVKINTVNLHSVGLIINGFCG